MKSNVCMPNELFDTMSDFKIVRYVRPTSCTSCQLELGLWRVYQKRLHKKFGNKVNVKFIVETQNNKEASRLIKMYNFEQHTYIDTLGNFAENNRGRFY